MPRTVRSPVVCPALALALTGLPALAVAQPQATPQQLVQRALQLVHDTASGLLPAGTWGSWDGTPAGVSTGNHQGRGGNASTTVPCVRFDDGDVMVGPSADAARGARARTLRVGPAPQACAPGLRPRPAPQACARTLSPARARGRRARPA